ncbi:hypothetical protein T11_12117 [Trichinella zimbabwensis]|uniref:Uncharacterized protein n=1 Tax=Trichinella zimbabwensis TaxID=268475 RepID=A0A0V1GS51_9BILA|nr:hypothetical protein T11_12117 [Trichinella zimbabwensis]
MNFQRQLVNEHTNLYRHQHRLCKLQLIRMIHLPLEFLS